MKAANKSLPTEPASESQGPSSPPPFKTTVKVLVNGSMEKRRRREKSSTLTEGEEAVHRTPNRIQRESVSRALVRLLGINQYREINLTQI